MKNTLSKIIFLAGALWAFAGFLEANADCPPTDLGAGALSTWARDTVDAATQGITLQNGTIIDQDCVDHLSGTARAARLARLNAAVQFASRQADACHQATNLPDPTNVGPTLAHTRIHCKEYNGTANAMTDEVVNHGYHPTQRLFMPLVTTHHFDRSYETTVNVGAISDLDRGEITDVAKSLFHEMLHFYSNNTTWHNEGDAHHPSYGCNNSLFTDRVYFMSAVCFPMSINGRAYYDATTGAAACPAVCDAALGHVDDIEEAHLEPWVYGADALVAKPLTVGDRRIICGRIADAQRRQSHAATDLRATLTLLRSSIDHIPAGIVTTPVGDLIPHLSDYLVPNGILTASSRADALAQFAHLRSRIESESARLCAPGAPVPSGMNSSELYGFCLDGRIRLGGVMDHVRTHLLQYEDGDFLMLRKVFDPTPLEVGVFGSSGSTGSTH
ncbi:MAG TPA: hypothetical protein VL588_00915 [Bdellovibrionota bacterium]|nr:hypothetical protein [Bdellovibrionota bacterium]